jgi:hypothetical protein
MPQAFQRVPSLSAGTIKIGNRLRNSLLRAGNKAGCPLYPALLFPRYLSVRLRTDSAKFPTCRPSAARLGYFVGGEPASAGHASDRPLLDMYATDNW